MVQHIATSLQYLLKVKRPSAQMTSVEKLIVADEFWSSDDKRLLIANRYAMTETEFNFLSPFPLNLEPGTQ